MRFAKWLPIAALALATLQQDAHAQGPKPDQIRFFETNIRPLFAQHCYKCHGPDKQRGDLRLDNQKSFQKGGSTGPLVIGGEPEKSLLIKAVRHRDPDFRMPPGKKISDREIGQLVAWVKMGAPYPADRIVTSIDGEPLFWAFKSPVDPPLPQVKNAAWAKTPLDRFILAKLEEKGLTPAAPADRRTLLRRVTFDLIGLPPTPEEVDAFLADQAPDAFARVVDRLLASPHYGERWGRHWLDVARYADSNGLDENVAYGNAWRYRDYVVGAFNSDKPYDQFLREQLAGDLLPETAPEIRKERLIATGFLSLGPKVLAEPDERKMEFDIIDEQVDSFCRAILGVTMGCARCHDHKFDPFTMDDYYGLAGVFKSTRTMENFTKIARWHENSIATPDEIQRQAEHDKKLADAKKRLKDLTAKADKAQLQKVKEEVAALEKVKTVLPSAMGVAEGKITDVPILKRGDHLRPDKTVARHFPVVFVGKQAPVIDPKSSGRLELAQWLTRPEHPLTARVMVNRIWRWHFGAGLVRTPDNFGRLGEAPDNQLLLDWLAHRFIENKWSIKAMHRLMLLSNTYQMSAAGNPKAEAIDPENRLHWRANVRRLEAEAIRDSLLAVAGQLDRTMGGPVLHVKNREFLFDHTSKDLTKYDSKRRSIYLPVVRNNVYDVFQLFDFPDPAVLSGDRATTTVAPQALFIMNSSWLAQLCDQYAETLLGQANVDDTARIRLLFRKSYARTPTESETARAVALVRNIDSVLTPREANADRRRLQAWATLCQTLFAANEFVYVD